MTAPFEAHLVTTGGTSPPLEQTARSYPRRSLGKGDTLYRAGDLADTVYLVGEGLVKLALDVSGGKERIVGVAGPGDFIGALTPMHVTFQESAEALSPRVEVQAIDVGSIDDSLLTAIYRAAGTHLLRLQEALEDNELPAASRLARALMRLGRRFGHTSEEGLVHLTLPLTHEHFAALVGAARETTTTLLSEMREAGVLHGTRGRYTFNSERMSEYAMSAAD